MNILIPNATSPRNIGDREMTGVLLSMLKETFPKAQIMMYSFDPVLMRKETGLNTKHSLYSYTAFQDDIFWKKMKRTLQLVLLIVQLRFNLPLISFDDFIKQMISEYRRADLIVFSPGGYIRSQHGIKQAINLLMQLLPFYLSKLTNAKTFVAPISIGPFAAKWQERLACRVLGGLDTVISREKITFKLLKQNGAKNIRLSTDLALLGSVVRKKKNQDSRIVGFTIRQWSTSENHRRVLECLVDALVRLAKYERVIIRPIVQVHAPAYGEDDSISAKDVVNRLRKMGVQVLPILYVERMKKPTHAYKDLDLLVGMRMHSNIIAAISGVPFVAIAYEYKTNGISAQLNHDEYVIAFDDVTPEKLYELIKKAYIQKHKLRRKIRLALDKLQGVEAARIVREMNMVLPSVQI